MRSAVFMILTTAMSALAADETPPGFLRNGDIWVFHGDSITHADTYRRMCERVFHHYHPEAKVLFLQAGVWGNSSSDAVTLTQSEDRKCSVVSLMTGMNNAINGGWVKGMPRDAELASYRKNIEEFVRKYKAEGAAVILMSPTLTDETCRRTFFRIDGANGLLRDFARVVQEVAEAEGAIYIPVQEEFEAFQDTLDRRQKLRPDGVHPASLGEYRIAQSLWEHLAFAAPLAQAKRGVVSSPAPLAASLRLTSRFLPPDAQGIDLLVAPCGSAALPSKLQAAWSIGEQRGHAELQSTNKLFSFPLPVKLPALQPGESTDAIIDLRDGNRSAVFVLDLCRVRVLHFSGDTLAESVSAPSGATLAGFRLTRQGPVLLLEAEVTDSVIKSGEMWAFSRDGLNLFLDLRGANLFGGINPDTQVHQAFVNVYEKPLFAAALRPWPGA